MTIAVPVERDPLSNSIPAVVLLFETLASTCHYFADIHASHRCVGCYICTQSQSASAHNAVNDFVFRSSLASLFLLITTLLPDMLIVSAMSLAKVTIHHIVKPFRANF